MPKRASLAPKRTTKRHVPWVVNLPAALSNTGRRERRYFTEKRVADQFCRQQRIRLENYGVSSTYLPAGKVEEAQEAFDRLNGTGVSLIEAVEEVLRLRRAPRQTPTFSNMFYRLDLTIKIPHKKNYTN